MNTIFTFLLTFVCLFAAPSSVAQMVELNILANSVDPEIDVDTVSIEDTVWCKVFLDPSLELREKLFVFLPGTGGKPADHYSEISRRAAELGYHSIGLVYKNTQSISALCGYTPDLNCSEDARLEIIYGEDLSDGVAVDEANSIQNRLSRLLIRLHEINTLAGWDNYVNLSDSSLIWNNIAFGGHSQGGGHAALIARDHSIDRLLFFNCPSDFNSHPSAEDQPSWFYDDFETSDSLWYAFYHQQNGGDNRLKVYQNFGMEQWGVVRNVDEDEPPYNFTHILKTDSNTYDYSGFVNDDCDDDEGTSEFDAHSDIIVDCELPKDVSGTNYYLQVWDYMLTNETNINQLGWKETDQIVQVYPNPCTGKIYFGTELSEDARLSVYTFNGQSIHFDRHKTYLEFPAISSGVYLMRIQLDGRIQQVKLIIQ